MQTPITLFSMSFEGRIALSGMPRRHFAFCEIGPVSPLPQPESQNISGIRSLMLRRRTRNANRGLKSILDEVITKYYRRPSWHICITPVFGNGTNDIVRDYEKVFSLFYDFVDLFCLDTTLCDKDGKRPLEDIDTFSKVLDTVLNLRRCYDDSKPIFVRVSPTSDADFLNAVIMLCRMGGVEAVMVGCSGKVSGSDNSKGSDKSSSNGRSSSRGSHFDDTLRTVRNLKESTLGRYPIIACTVRLRPAEIAELLDAGASLVQGRCGIFSPGARRIGKKVTTIQAAKQLSNN